MENKDFRKAFGGRLKRVRKRRQWPQKKVAARVGIRFQQLNKYESGLNLPPADTLIRLADALSVSVDYLLTGGAGEGAPIGDRLWLRRLKAVQRLEPEDQEIVIRLIDAMIAKQRMQAVLESTDRPVAGT